MNHRFVMLHSAFPSHQQSPKLVGLPMRPFHDPAAHGVLLLRLALRSRLPALLQMQEIIPLQHARDDGFIIVPCVQAQVMPPLVVYQNS